MPDDVCPMLTPDDRVRLEAIVAARTQPQKHVMRAQIVLSSAEGLSATEVAKRLGCARTTAQRWQRRFAGAGIDGLLGGKTRERNEASVSHGRISNNATKAKCCVYCGNDIPKSASYCTKCQKYQDPWRNFLPYLSYAGGLAAVLTILAGPFYYAHQIWNTIQREHEERVAQNLATQSAAIKEPLEIFSKAIKDLSVGIRIYGDYSHNRYVNILTMELLSKDNDISYEGCFAPPSCDLKREDENGRFVDLPLPPNDPIFSFADSLETYADNLTLLAGGLENCWNAHRSLLDLNATLVKWTRPSDDSSFDPPVECASEIPKDPIEHQKKIIEALKLIIQSADGMMADIERALKAFFNESNTIIRPAVREKFTQALELYRGAQEKGDQAQKERSLRSVIQRYYDLRRVIAVSHDAVLGALIKAHAALRGMLVDIEDKQGGSSRKSDLVVTFERAAKNWSNEASENTRGLIGVHGEDD